MQSVSAGARALDTLPPLLVFVGPDASLQRRFQKRHHMT